MQLCYKINRWDMDGSEKRRLILIKLMAEKGMGNQDLAKAAELHEVSVSRYVTGASRLNDVKTLEKLAKGLGEDICVFFEEPRDRDVDSQEATIRAMKRDIEILKDVIMSLAPPGAWKGSPNFQEAAAKLHQKKPK